MKHKQRMYKQLMILLVSGMIFAGCAQKAGGVEPVPTETVSEEVVESTEVETATEEPETLEITAVEESTTEAKEESTEVEGELYEEDVNLPVIEECEYILSFKESNDEIVNLVYAKEDYESKRGFTCAVDMDRDGNVETFVMTPLYKGLISNNGKDEYIASDLWLVEANGEVHKILENIDLSIKVYLYETNAAVFVVVNSSPAFVNEKGFIVGYRNGEIILRNDFPGYIAMKENREMVVWAEDYLGLCDIGLAEEKPKAPRDGLWMWHTWTPYYLYYSEEKQDFVQYQAIEISKETAGQVANLDETEFQDADAVQYIYVENGYLEVNASDKVYDEEGNLEQIHFDIYEFKLNNASQTWDFVQERSGIYRLGYYEEIVWDILDEPLK